MNDDIIKHIHNTLSILEHVPEQYRKEAFDTILKYFLHDESKFKEQSIKQVFTTKGRESVERILKTRFDWASLPILSLKPTPQILLIMKIVKENFNIDELSANDVKIILMEKFRISKSTSAISMLLMEKLGKYVDRISEGNRFYYRITDNGMSFVESELKEVSK